MSNELDEELSENGSLTPPLADIERQWQEFAHDIDTEISPKRQKTKEFYEESKAKCFAIPVANTIAMFGNFSDVKLYIIIKYFELLILSEFYCRFHTFLQVLPHKEDRKKVPFKRRLH